MYGFIRHNGAFKKPRPYEAVKGLIKHIGAFKKPRPYIRPLQGSLKTFKMVLKGLLRPFKSRFNAFLLKGSLKTSRRLFKGLLKVF